MGTEIIKLFKSQKQLFILLALFVLGLAKSIFFSKLGFGLLDEGENLHNGLRILGGDLPYRDFYTLLPPLDNFWPAIAFKLFGVSIFSPRLFSSIVFSFLPPTIFLIARRNVASYLAVIPSILIIFMDLNIERIYYFSFIFAGLLLFLYSLNFKKQRLKMLAGILLGTGGLIRLDLAGGFLVGILLTMFGFTIVAAHKNKLKSWFSHCLTLSLGFSGMAFFLFLWLLKNNLIDAFLNAFLINSFAVTKAYSLPFPNLAEVIPLDFSPSALMNSYRAWFAYIIVTTYLAFTLFFIKNWFKVWKHHLDLIILFIIGLIISPYMLGRSDLGHLMKGGIPFLIIGPFLIYRFLETKRIKKNIYRYLILIVPIIIFIANLIQSWWWIKFNNTKVTFNKGTVYLNSAYPYNSTFISAQTIKRSVEFIETNTQKDEPFLAVPYMAGLYFLSDRPSQTYIDNIFVSFLPSENQFINDIERLKIDTVVYDPEHGPQSSKPKLKDYYPSVDQYIMKNFEVVEKTAEGWLFMKRKI